MSIRTPTHNRQAYEQFIAAQERTGSNRRFELIHGEIVEKMPTQMHAFIVALLTTALVNFVMTRRLGRVLVEARYQLEGDDHNARIPDISFVSSARGAIVTTGAAPYLPDLAVEVQSRSQGEKLLAEKAAYYLANGTRMVWLIYPAQRIIEVLTEDSRALLTAADTLDGGEVLPGFNLNLTEFFQTIDAQEEDA